MRPMSDDLRTRRLQITATLTLDATAYPQDDAQAEAWLINDILLSGMDRLQVWSQEIGDELGFLRVERVEACD